MRRDKEHYDAADLHIVLIGLGTPDKARDFRQSLALPFTVLCDPEKQSYRAFGLLRRINVLREANPTSVRRVFADSAQYGGAWTNQDMMQLGGVFVVDRAGIIRFAFEALRASDQPATADVLGSMQA